MRHLAVSCTQRYTCSTLGRYGATCSHYHSAYLASMKLLLPGASSYDDMDAIKSDRVQQDSAQSPPLTSNRSFAPKVRPASGPLAFPENRTLRSTQALPFGSVAAPPSAAAPLPADAPVMLEAPRLRVCAASSGAEAPLAPAQSSTERMGQHSAARRPLHGLAVSIAQSHTGAPACALGPTQSSS